MPKRTDINKILVIGSGPIVIGQAAEFDYSGTQACLALKEEGYKVILVNSNPATIMTDTNIADKVYMEPLNLEYVARIIRMERPDAIIPTLGGQTGLNLAMQLAQKGVLDECGVEILGTPFDSIDQAEDREKFKDLCVYDDEMNRVLLASASRCWKATSPIRWSRPRKRRKRSAIPSCSVRLLPWAAPAAVFATTRKNC